MGAPSVRRFNKAANVVKKEKKKPITSVDDFRISMNTEEGSSDSIAMVDIPKKKANVAEEQDDSYYGSARPQDDVFGVPGTG